jgi:hypothetical protein
MRDGSVLWMGDLPEHLAVRSAHCVGEPESEQPLLVVDRLPASAVPLVPIGLASWLEGPTDNENGEPGLCESIPNPKPLADDGSDVELALKDHPDVQEAHELWQPQWAAWAQTERADRPVRDLYGSLFSTYVKVSSHSEELELILGIGCLAWSPADHPRLRRHVLTSPAAIALDDDSGTITVSAQPALETLTVELDMIDPSLVPNPVHINDVRRRARDFEQHPLHRAYRGQARSESRAAPEVGPREHVGLLDSPNPGQVGGQRSLVFGGQVPAIVAWRRSAPRPGIMNGGAALRATKAGLHVHMPSPPRSISAMSVTPK